MITGGIYPIPNSQFIHEIRNGASRDELINIVLTLAVRGEARDNGVSVNMANITDAVRHPAKYTDALLPVLARMAEGCQRILDPMAGTGKIFSLVRYGFAGEIHANELEQEWAQQHPLTRVGDASSLPFPDGFFDGIVTSPAYGNRCADRFVPGEGWEEARKSRNTYTHALGRPLTSGSTGALQWGPAYREAHIAIWREADRLLAPNGRIILNCSDHIRAGKVVPVTQWHIDTICALGYTVTQREQVQTPRNGFGQNGKARVAYEEVIRMDKTAQGEEA